MLRSTFAFHAGARRLEDVFLTRYEWLRKRALVFVSGDRAQADDLVHDLFVELRLGSIDPGEIRDPEAYLSRALRNLHISSLRRAARAPMRALSVVDYDSVDALLSDTRDDPARTFEDAEDIRRVCLYGCSRKETSKAASALILRFFYGYTPQATATLMRISAAGVDQWLSLARAEVRVFLRESRVASIDGDMPSIGDEVSDPSVHQDLLVSLRRRILTTRQGPCLGEVELARWDVSGSESVDRERLAHLVSCRACLESVTARVGLPSPWELASRDESDGGPNGAWGSGRRRRSGVTRKAGPGPTDAGIARLQAVATSTHDMPIAPLEATPSVPQRLREWLSQIGLGRPAIRPWWSHGIVKACGVVFVCWLLFGGGADVLASTTGRAIDVVRSWIISLLQDANREPSRIASTPISGGTEPAGIPVPAPPVRPVMPRERAIVLDASARARIELEILRVLQPVHAYLGQEIALGMTHDGRVAVQGVISDTARREALVGALATMGARDRQYVTLDLPTADEATARERTAAAAGQGSESPTPTLHSYAVTASRFPAFDRVRAALERDASAGEPSSTATLDRQAQRFAGRVLTLSLDASQHSTALRNIGSRMLPGVVSTLSVKDRETFDSVIAWHATRLEESLLALGNELLRVYGPSGAQPWPPAPPPAARRATRESVWTLIDRVAELDPIRAHAVMRAFSASPLDEGDADIVETGDLRALITEYIRVTRLLRSP